MRKWIPLPCDLINYLDGRQLRVWCALRQHFEPQREYIFEPHLRRRICTQLEMSQKCLQRVLSSMTKLLLISLWFDPKSRKMHIILYDHAPLFAKSCGGHTVSTYGGQPVSTVDEHTISCGLCGQTHKPKWHGGHVLSTVKSHLKREREGSYDELKRCIDLESKLSTEYKELRKSLWRLARDSVILEYPEVQRLPSRERAWVAWSVARGIYEKLCERHGITPSRRSRKWTQYSLALGTRLIADKSFQMRCAHRAKKTMEEAKIDDNYTIYSELRMFYAHCLVREIVKKKKKKFLTRENSQCNIMSRGGRRKNLNASKED